MAAPPVQHLASQHDLISLTERPGHLFFLYAGIQEGPLWVSLNFTLDIVTLPLTLIASFERCLLMVLGIPYSHKSHSEPKLQSHTILSEVVCQRLVSKIFCLMQ